MIQVETTPYGADAHRALAAEIARLKGGDPLRPVSVVVSSNPIGIAARGGARSCAHARLYYAARHHLHTRPHRTNPQHTHPRMTHVA